jgi:DNA primase
MGSFFSEATIAQVQAASDIVEVIGAVVPLKRAGANFVGLCPFHKEKRPSFNVSPQKQAFYCFGCHKGGTVLTFVQFYENLNFPEAVRRLAERAHIVLETEDNPGARGERSIRERLFELHDVVAKRWQQSLLNDAGGQPARDYLEKRRVPAEAIKLFGLGYAPDSWDDTINFGRSKGFDPELLEKGGLATRKEGGNLYDRFRGRLMFPICDEQGRVIGFSGRVLDPEAKSAKYVNSPETPLFTKGKVIYGLDKAKRALLEKEYAVICEGQLDLIACHMAGIQNVVAPQGTALTADHIRILRRYVNEVVLCFDADAAGQNATIRSLDELIASNMAIRVARVPAPHDPDSFIKEKGGDAFSKIIEEAPGFFDFYLNQLCVANDVGTDRGKLAVLNSMAEAVLKTGNSVLIETYAQQTALKLLVPPEAVRPHFKLSSRNAPSRAPADRFEEEDVLQESVARPSPSELWLLKFVFHDEQQLEWVAAHLNPEWIVHPGVREIILQRLRSHLEGTWNGSAGFIETVHDESGKALLAEMLCDPRPLKRTEENIKGGGTSTCGLVERIRNAFLDRQIALKTAQASVPGLTDQERTQLLSESLLLKRSRREPLKPIINQMDDVADA